MIRIGYICPVYKAAHFHQYTLSALESFFATTPGGVAIVVDDGSPEWSTFQDIYYKLTRKRHQQIHFVRFDDQVGLTRSWNAGLNVASELDLDYAVASNNDIVFPSAKWSEGLLHALVNGYSMVGPLSNAPGITAKGKQEIDRYFGPYELTDDASHLAYVLDNVYDKYLGHVVESPVNGFFQMASMDSWRQGKFSRKYYYRPVNKFTSKGALNPTPNLTLNEDELQARWARKGMKSAVVLSSFIFHYRAVSRGDRYKRGKWFRKS